ncbi:MAG TPA: TonB-dependent receptor [Gemmatimonadales bacterium]|nr:TonB-dependent receptor [Gemmatimonadales bacterium]
MKQLIRSLLFLVVAAAAPPLLAAQGTASVTGRVVDSTTAQPVVGARVSVVGATAGVVTDRDGRYLLPNLAAGTVTLRAQRIGYTPLDRVVTLVEGGTVTQDFALGQAATLLSDIVVTGYGTTNRENITGAVASVGAAQFENTPIAGVDAAMQGRAAGVQVTQNAGNPGAGITVRIRGSASINASNQPLYVIDGVPLLRDEYSQLLVGGQDITAVTGVNPDEIASIDILKDASSAAIYGSRASNGVVMITTKRGRAGGGQVSFSTYIGQQDVPKNRRWEMMSGPEYVEYMNEGATNDGYAPFYFGDPADPTLPNSDWQDAILRTAPVQNMNVSASGGSDRIQYYVSGGQFKQVGVVFGSGYSRQSGRVNADVTATDRLTFRASLNFNREDHDRIENDDTIAGVVTNAIASPPYIPVKRSDGEYTGTADGLPYVNPRAIAAYSHAESRSLRAIGSFETIYQMRNGVTLNGRFGLDVLNVRDLKWDSPRVSGSYAEDVGGDSQMGNTTANRYVVEAFANAKPNVSPSLNLDVTGGASVEWNGSDWNFLEGIGFPSDRPQYPGNAATVTVYDGDWSGYNMVSFFSRANAQFKDKYLLSASVRADGSSRFGENHRYGWFPAAAFGWMLTKESFASGLARHADLKLRASFGVTGNHDIDDDFAHVPRFGRANYVDVAGQAKSSFGNPDLRWENTHEINAGFDLTLLQGRVSLVADWYRKETRDLLQERPITSTSGSTFVLQNVGNMENRGYELTLDVKPIQSAQADGLRWNTNLNIAWNRNKVTKLFDNQPYSVGGYSASRVVVGQPLAVFYVIRFLGVDPATGDAIYDDINNDGSINDADRVYIGSPHPKYWGGFTNEITWKGFDLRGFLQFSRGFKIFNAINVFANDGGYYYDNKFRKALRRWRQPGDVTDEPRASFDGVSGADLISSRYFEDGSYVRLQELTLGYKLPQRVGNALRLRDGRVYVSGRNLYTWTKYSGYSPDVNSDGSDSNTALATEFYAYPAARSFMFGISGSF